MVYCRSCVSMHFCYHCSSSNNDCTWPTQASFLLLTKMCWVKAHWEMKWIHVLWPNPIFKKIMDSHIIAKEAFFSYTCHWALVLYYILVRSQYDDNMKIPDPNDLWLKFNILVGSYFATSIAPLITSLCHPLHWQIYPLVSDALYRPIGQRTGDTLVIQYFIIAFFPVVFP